MSMTRFAATAPVQAAALAAVALFAQTAAAQTRDTSPTFETILNNGAASNRVDIIFIGDGYTSTQKSIYDFHVNETIEYMFGSRLNDPLPRYQNFFNVHQVNVVSQQSGADDPNGGTYVDTALSATYNTNGIDRLLYFNTGAANTAVSTALSGTGIDVDMRLGTVNSTKYGGGGGQWAVWSAGNGSARDIAIHELGHSFAGLQDEYDYGGPTVYQGGESAGFVNVSTDPENKWGQWYGYDDPFHDISVVGAYEGAQYSEEGIFRPTQDSMMRSLGKALNAPSREEVILDIYREVDPLDGFLDNTQTLLDPEFITVDRVDDSVIALDWFVDGQLVLENGDDLFDIDSLNLAPGDYEVSVLAFDTVLDFAFTGLDYDWVRRDFDLLQQTVAWNVSITAIPEPTTLATLLLAPALLLRRRR